MADIKKLKLTNLLINTENYRFDPAASQREAIDQMVSDQNQKLYNLAKHILENGFNPNDKIQVVTANHDPLKYNVVEGNRRTTALKLLNSPDLIEGHASLKKKFKKLHDDNKSKLIREIECTVYDSPSEADKWIKLKHAGQVDGIGTVAWTSQQVQRFEEKVEGKSSIALQTIKLLETAPEVPAAIKNQLGSLKITNLDRMISDPDVRDFVGITVHNGIIQSDVDRAEVIKGLTKIAKDLLDPSFNVKKIYTKDDRSDYISGFSAKQKPDTSKKAAKPWQLATSIGPSPKPSAKPKANPKDREKLVPKSCVLTISNPKLNKIYHELQKLNIVQFTNAAAVSFRVFVELSMDCYIEYTKLTTATKDSSLHTKITAVANHLETNKLADKHICKGIRSGINNKNDLLGIETWHAYIHNARFSPTPPNLITMWDNIQTFIEKLWENVK